MTWSNWVKGGREEASRGMRRRRNDGGRFMRPSVPDTARARLSLRASVRPSVRPPVRIAEKATG